MIWATPRILPILEYLLLDLQPVIKIGNTDSPIIIKKKKNLLLNIILSLKKGIHAHKKTLSKRLNIGLMTKIKLLNFFDHTILRDKSPRAYLKGWRTPLTPT